MSKNLQTQASASEASAEVSAQHAHAGLSSEAALRRRMLMSSLGKGSVVVAAASVSMHTLAGQSTRCKTSGTNNTPVVNAAVSGMQSFVGSMGATFPVSNGYGCSHYGTASNWPGYSNGTSCRSKSFSSVFGSGSTKTCGTIVANPTTYPDECRWVLAYLNGTKCFSTKYFPYDSNEVKALYTANGTGGKPSRANCVAFFKTHMEHLT
jgi:hypothetical protein